MVLPTDSKSLPPGSGNGKLFRHTRFLNFEICERRVTSQMHSSMNPFVVSATCYVVSGKLGQHNEWDEALGMAQAALMGVEEMRRWVDAGMEVGSHTCSHADLNQLSLAEAGHELLQSKSDLENLLQKPVTQFCYPYGHFSPEHESLVSQSGYVAATTTHRGRACATDRMTALPRVPVVRSTYSLQFLLAEGKTQKGAKYRMGA